MLISVLAYPQNIITWWVPIFNAIKTRDPHEAYLKTTKGYVDLDLQNLQLYAPETWDNNTSLHYFIPDTHPLSNLLSPHFFMRRGLSFQHIIRYF